MNMQTSNNATGQAPATEDSVIAFMREMREQFGTFEFKAVSPGGTVLCTKNWHRMPHAVKELPLFLPEEPVRGAK